MHNAQGYAHYTQGDTHTYTTVEHTIHLSVIYKLYGAGRGRFWILKDGQATGKVIFAIE